jgi:misacylated tRNA(Ala) deacylase
MLCTPDRCLFRQSIPANPKEIVIFESQPSAFHNNSRSMLMRMTKALYLEDSYGKECDSLVVSIKDGRFVVLDQTVFYPKGGGQPWDTGKMVRENEDYNVTYVGKFAGEISHEVDHAGLKVGDKVHCSLDWKRRYRLMRSHTAAHVFASLLCTGVGVLVTGNQLEEDKVRFDFSLEKFDRGILEDYINKANQLFNEDIPVKWYELPREEALKISGVIKMAEAFPPDIPRLRIVEIVGVDKQADGGTHVRNLKEVGHITLLKTENKGKSNRRVYFTLS